MKWRPWRRELRWALLALLLLSAPITGDLTAQDTARWTQSPPHLAAHSLLLLFCALILLICAAWVCIRPNSTLTARLAALLTLTLTTLANGLTVTGVMLLYLDNVRLGALWFLVGFSLFTTVSLVLLTVLGYQHHRRALSAARRLQELDPLTGLLNRAGLRRHGESLLTRQGLQVVMIDLNNLKLVNDLDGHEVGDAFIQQLAASLTAHLPGGAYAGRWGGDEFLLLLPTGTDTEHLVRRVQADLPHPRGMTHAFSWGVAAARCGSVLEQTLALADQRMYEQKIQEAADLTAAGNNSVQLQSFTQYLLSLAEVPQILRDGLERCLAITGFDALAYFRLGHPDDAQLTPVAWVRPAGHAASVLDPDPVPREGLIAEAVQQRRTRWDADFGSRAELSEKGRQLGLRSALIAPVLVNDQVAGVLGLATFRSWQAITAQNRLILEALAMYLGHALERQATVSQLHRTLEHSVRELGIVLEVRDLETAGHTDRVAELARRFGEEIGLSRDQHEFLRLGAYLHDVGKLSIPDSVLLKPGRLDAAERRLIETHTVRGAELVQRLPSLPAEVIDIVLSHHERWDGLGYPHSLTGEQIPLLARVFALCDVYDALTSKRPYKAAWPSEQALSELRAQAGEQFDPQLTAAFVNMMTLQETGRTT